MSFAGCRRGYTVPKYITVIMAIQNASNNAKNASSFPRDRINGIVADPDAGVADNGGAAG